jgi:hypothetical protein
MSSGSRRADSAVEPTRSANITVSWRRSAASWGFGSVDGGSAVALATALLRSAIAASIFHRCPSKTPSAARSASVKCRRTETSIPFSSKRWVYWPRPRLPSHSAICCIAAPWDLSWPNRRFRTRRKRVYSTVSFLSSRPGLPAIAEALDVTRYVAQGCAKYLDCCDAPSTSDVGQTAKNSPRAYVFRLAPELGHCSTRSALHTKKAACVATSGPSLGRKRPRRAAIAGWGWGRYRITPPKTIAISGSIERRETCRVWPAMTVASFQAACLSGNSSPS